MIFDFGTFSIDVDVEKTRKYYAESNRTLTEGCDCILCRNFLAAYESLDASIRNFFDSLGVDIRKAGDMTTMHGDKERNILYYQGICHICGRIVDGGVEKSYEKWHWEQTPEREVMPNLKVFFKTDCALVEQSFPRPVLQLEVDMEVPWVMGGNFEDVL